MASPESSTPINGNVAGRVAFLRRVLIEPYNSADLLTAPFISYGRHEQAEHRINLAIAALHLAYNEVLLSGDLRGMLGEWIDSEPVHLDFQKPMKYLGHAETFSDSLWLGAAATSFSGDMSFFSEEEIARHVQESADSFAVIEEQYRPSPEV